MPWRKITTLKFWVVAIVLCILAALAAIGLSRFLEAFYSYAPASYEPKDLTRGEQVERSKE